MQADVHMPRLDAVRMASHVHEHARLRAVDFGFKLGWGCIVKLSEAAKAINAQTPLPELLCRSFTSGGCAPLTLPSLIMSSTCT